MASPVLGIDIAKLKFNACLLRQGGKPRHKVFPNTAEGFAQLAGWLTRQGAPKMHACMEPTGAYGEALAPHPHAAGHRVSVVNPAAVKAFAQSRLSGTETDKVDAELIARFCLAQRPPAWAPPAPEARERQSGSSVRGRVRLSKIGNSRLRKALYFPAVTAIRCSAFFQSRVEGLRQRGKSKMAVIGAVMRKLVHLAYGVLKPGKPFDSEWAKAA